MKLEGYNGKLEDTNRLKFNLSFFEDGLSELPYVQMQRENFRKLAELIVKRFDDAQNAAVSLAYARFLDLAEGDMLDKIASHYFIDRNGKSDSTLRSAIKIFALRQNTEPTRPEIVKILNVLTDSGFVKIYKGTKNYVEVVLSIDCVPMKDLASEIEGLFPINTNLKLCSVPVGRKPFGVVSIHSTKPSKKIGTLGSVHDPIIKQNNVATVTVLDNERD